MNDHVRMSIFSRRRRASTASFVLAFWVFALLASIAQACGLGGPIEHAGFAVPAVSGPHQTPGDGASPACEKFCADESALLTKLKAVEDAPAGNAVVTPSPVHGIPAVIPERNFEPLCGAGPPPGIAINTRFVRLAL